MEETVWDETDETVSRVCNLHVWRKENKGSDVCTLTASASRLYWCNHLSLWDEHYAWHVTPRTWHFVDGASELKIMQCPWLLIKNNQEVAFSMKTYLRVYFRPKASHVNFSDMQFDHIKINWDFLKHSYKACKTWGISVKRMCRYDNTEGIITVTLSLTDYLSNANTLTYNLSHANILTCTLWHANIQTYALWHAIT